jgi:hypothetical protein
MAAEKMSQQNWIKLPGRLYVSSDRMTYDGASFRLSHAAGMNIEKFNDMASQYDVQPIENSDPPIDRFVRVNVLLSRMYKDNSFLPNNAQYVDTALKAAVARAKYDELVKNGAAQEEAQRFKPLADFYDTLKTGPLDTVAEVLEFHERLVGGRNNGKYKATPHAFNRDGMLEPADNAIMIAPEGWQRVLGRRGYPTDTDKDECSIENVEDAGLSGRNLQGYWFVGSDPVGQQRIVLRGPDWGGEGLLSASVREGRSCSSENVGALRLREMLPED